jgi:hypothetical protein
MRHEYGSIEFHDAVLSRFVITWPERNASLTLHRSSDPRVIEIVARSMTALHCDQLFPWGHSAEIYVNDVVWSYGPDGEAVSVDIETQNGDHVVITAAQIYLRSPD